MAKRSNSKRKVIPEAQTRDDGILSTEFVLPGWKLVLIHAAIIVAAGLWIYWPALHGDWLWDDDMYISGNHLLLHPARLWKAWFQPGSFIEYYPIEETVQWIQWHLWHKDTFGYHLTNVILHLINALLVWRLLVKFRVRLAWIGGLIFVVHSFNVESVAWISELKNTLSLCPFLLAMCVWIDYEESKRRGDYLLALVLFLVAMLCKITMAPFPVVILVYAWWKRGRIGWSDLRASAPFFLISLVLGLTTHWVGVYYWKHYHLQPMVPPPLGGFFSKLALAGLTIAFYFGKFFWPVPTTPMHHQWPVDPPTLLQFMPWLVLGVLGYWFWRRRETWGRHVILGMVFFLINLVPFLGFNSISYMSFTWVMDHLLYIPMIGLIGLVTAALSDIDERLPVSVRPFGTGLLAVALVLMAFQSHAYSAAFTNSETLWSNALEQNPRAWLAHDFLGKALLLDHQWEEAKSHFDATLAVKPDFADAYANLGTALFQTGRVPEGVEQFRKALSLNPNDAMTRNNLGVVLGLTGRLPEALRQFECALREQPNYTEAHNNMGNTLLLAGRISEAIEQFQAAVRINPSYAAARDNLGLALAQTGHIPEAMEQYRQALQIDPNDDKARDGLAKLQQSEMQPNAPGKN